MIRRFAFLFNYIYQYKFSYLAGIFFIILTNWISVTIPEYLKRSVDLLTSQTDNLVQNQRLLLHYLVVMLLLAFSIIFVRALSRIFFFNPGRAIEYQVKNDLFKKLTLLQKDYYDENPSGTIISRIQNDINGIRLICGFGMMQIFNITTALSLTPYKMVQLSPRLTLYVLIPIIIVFIIIRIGMHFVTRNTKAKMQALQELSGFTVSSLAGIDVIKGFSLSNWSINRFSEYNKRMLLLSLKISFFRSFLLPILQNLENILKIIILAVGGYYAIKLDFTIGELTAFIAYSALLSMPIMGLGWLTTIIETGMVGVASIETILSRKTAEPQLVEKPSFASLNMFEKGVEVCDLSYTYPGQQKPVLENISFSIKPNQTIGILGQIGSGKTTLVNCLNRYLKVQDRSIFIGGVDINLLSYSEVRRHIRTVSQDIFLFSDSIAKNIIFGARDEAQVNREDLERISYECAILEEIQRFPDKFETMIGEKGIMLSGGQKQRISLARSLMAPFDLLILDNILSAVDYETERFLLKKIEKRRTAKSLLVVSHRVQALENADTILVLDKGKIVDKGTYSELINREGLFMETWKLQEQG